MIRYRALPNRPGHFSNSPGRPKSLGRVTSAPSLGTTDGSNRRLGEFAAATGASDVFTGNGGGGCCNTIAAVGCKAWITVLRLCNVSSIAPNHASAELTATSSSSDRILPMRLRQDRKQGRSSCGTFPPLQEIRIHERDDAHARMIWFSVITLNLADLLSLLLVWSLKVRFGEVLFVLGLRLS